MADTRVHRGNQCWDHQPPHWTEASARRRDLGVPAASWKYRRPPFHVHLHPAWLNQLPGAPSQVPPRPLFNSVRANCSPVISQVPTGSRWLAESPVLSPSQLPLVLVSPISQPSSFKPQLPPPALRRPQRSAAVASHFYPVEAPNDRIFFRRQAAAAPILTAASSAISPSLP
ncbi:hypothetical protein FALBO_2985, partial [Fusarium albosuccineum]